MTTAHNAFTKVAFWLLAILVPVQPVLSLDCPCNCQTGAETKRADHPFDNDFPVKSACCTHCKKSCRDAETPKQRQSTEVEPTAVRRPRRVNKTVMLALRPCRCGDDCPCQISHEVRPGIVEAKTTNADFDVYQSSTSVVCELPELIASATAFIEPFNTGGTTGYSSALEICAHLCRFTI